MELLSFHNESIADFAPDNQDDNRISLDIIQGTQVTSPQFKRSERIGAQALDRFRGRRGLVLQPGQDSGFQDPLLAYWQRLELPVRHFRDGDVERHAIDSAAGSRANSSSAQHKVDGSVASFVLPFELRQFPLQPLQLGSKAVDLITQGLVGRSFVGPLPFRVYSHF